MLLAFGLAACCILPLKLCLNWCNLTDYNGALCDQDSMWTVTLSGAAATKSVPACSQPGSLKQSLALPVGLYRLGIIMLLIVTDAELYRAAFVRLVNFVTVRQAKEALVQHVESACRCCAIMHCKLRVAAPLYYRSAACRILPEHLHVACCLLNCKLG